MNNDKEVYIIINGKKVPFSKLPCAKCKWYYSMHCPKCNWKETEFDIQIISKIPTYYLKIRIFKNAKTYQGIITLEEHQLLTKTFKMLGWGNNNDC